MQLGHPEVVVDDQDFDAAGIYAGMLITTVLALVAEWLITKLELRLTAWRPPATTHTAGL